MKLLSLIILSLFIIQFVVTNELAGLGGKVKDVDREITRVAHENETLEERLAMEISLSTLESKAETLGFVEATKQHIISLPQTLPVAINTAR